MEEGRGRLGGREVSDAGGERVGDWFCGVRVRIRVRKDASNVAGVGAEVEDRRELSFYVLGSWD